MLAYIREVECIGCTKCIQACPVDAIVGASKRMHTVLEDLCTGCELCVAPCPVDCIELLLHARPRMSAAESDVARTRHRARQLRIDGERLQLKQDTLTVNAAGDAQALQAALARARARHGGDAKP
jgi:electron transport complex protein RnfB